MRRYLTTTAALTALLFACGKDEPPAPVPPPAAATPDAQAALTPTPEGAKVEDNKPLTADPAKTEPSREPSAVAPTEPGSSFPGERAPLTPTTIATFPTDIVAIGGTPSLQGLVAAFTSQLKNMPNAQVPPDPLPMAIAALQGQLGIDLGWLELDKPLRFAVPDPKKYPEGFVVLLPAKASADEQLAKLPGTTPGNGHTLTVDLQGKKLFIDRVVDGHLLVTSHDDLAKPLESFVKELAAWTPKDPLVLESSGENLVRIYREDMQNAKEMIEMMASAGGGDPRMKQMIDMAAGGFALVEGSSRLSLSLDPSGDFPRIGLGFVGLPGSPLEKIAKGLAGRKIAFADAVPSDAWLALGFDIEGASYLQDAEAIVEAVTSKASAGPLQQITWSDEEKAKLLGLLKRAQTLSGSQSMMWLRQEGTRPFIFESLSDATDGVALHATMMELGEFFYVKVWGEGRKAMLAQGMSEADLPTQLSFKDFVGMASKPLGAMGMSMAVNESTTLAGTKVGALEVNIDWTRLPLQGPMAHVGELIGNSIGISLGGESKVYSSVIGPNAVERATKILDAAATPVPQSDAWLAMAKDQALFALVRPARLLRALVELVPDLAAKRAEIMALSDDPLVVRGRSDGAQVYIEVTLPMKVIAGLANIR